MAIGRRVTRLLALAFTIVVASSSLAAPPEAGTEQNPAAFDHKEAEAEAVSLLAAGKQPQAEALLEQSLSHFPDAVALIELLAAKKQQESQEFVDEHAEQLKTAQRLLFLHGAVVRSRFYRQRGFVIFSAVLLADATTPSGKCAALMVKLDSSLQRAASLRVGQRLENFKELADDHLDDVVIRWMAAVQCRTWNRNEEGVEHYQKILEKWHPGPSLVHQTYANLLDQVQRYDDALVERKITIKMEPAGWSYDGLANTLNHLGRFDEADAAHAAAVEADPKTARLWCNWAYNLKDQGKFAPAIEKCEHAAELETDNPDSDVALPWWIWAQLLEAEGKLGEALEKCKAALEHAPQDPAVRAKVAELEQRLKN